MTSSALPVALSSLDISASARGESNQWNAKLETMRSATADGSETDSALSFKKVTLLQHGLAWAIRSISKLKSTPAVVCLIELQADYFR
ncbi:MAG: hypothetical protein ACI81V_001272 [Lentimonas sp.]|jgi:hypothetical protein